MDNKMGISMIKGQKIEIPKSGPDINLLDIGFKWTSDKQFDIDVSAFLLDKDEKILTIEDFVFYGQPISSNGSVSLEEPASSGDKQHFSVHLSKVQDKVEKILFAITIYESEKNGHTFSEVKDIELVIVHRESGQEIGNFLMD